MGDSVHRAIWHIRVKLGIYISRKTERYIVDELEEDLFPYGFGDGSYDDVFRDVWGFVKLVNSGEFDIDKPMYERLLERYELLKEEHYRLLAKINRMEHRHYEGKWDDDLPF